MTRPLASLLLAVAAVGGLPASAAGQLCEAEAAYRALDFWIGDWTVWVGDDRVGANRIESILGGCAILEQWTDARGLEGMSLFYFHPAEETWKQVWVTERAMRPGGLKEKRLVAALDDGGLRFQGEIVTPEGSYLDRTTLTPLPDGTVRQVIERSTDGGATWTVGFDAVYRRSYEPLDDG